MSLTIQAIVLLAAGFLMMRGVQVLQENLRTVEAIQKLRLSMSSLAYIAPIMLFIFFAAGRITTAEMILPFVIGFNLLMYGVVFAYSVMSRTMTSLADVSRSVVLPMMLTYSLVMLSAIDGDIDRFEAVVMLVFGSVLWFGISARIPDAAEAVSVPHTFVQAILFILIAVVAVYLGIHYVFAGVLFFSVSYTLSLVFLALTTVPFVLALPLIVATFSLSRQGQGALAITQMIWLTLVITLWCIGIAGSSMPLSTATLTIESGLWYVVLFVATTILGLLSGTTERLGGGMLFLLFIFCMVKLVTEL